MAGKLKKLTGAGRRGRRALPGRRESRQRGRVLDVSRWQSMHDPPSAARRCAPQQRYAAETTGAVARASDRAHNTLEKAVARGLLTPAVRALRGERPHGRWPPRSPGAPRRLRQTTGGSMARQKCHHEHQGDLSVTTIRRETGNLTGRHDLRRVPVVRARTSRSLERVQVLTESEVDYGESTPVWLASPTASCSWRTSGLFAAEDSPLYWETLAAIGYDAVWNPIPLPPLVRPIYGTGLDRCCPRRRRSSATAPRDAERGDGSVADGPGSRNLTTRWPCCRRRRPATRAAAAAATPRRAKAHPGVSPHGLGARGRRDGRLLPTLQAQDHRNCADYSDGSRGHSPQLRHLGRDG